MADNGSLILEDEPKKLVYLKKLLTYDQPSNFYERAKTFFTADKTRPHSISEWAEIVGSKRNNGNTRSFLESLADKDALQLEGERQSGNKTYKVYSVNKDRLLKVFSKSTYYHWNRDLMIKTINKAESNRKVIKDF